MFVVHKFALNLFMKTPALISFIALTIIQLNIFSQALLCDSRALEYYQPGITLDTSQFSFNGDSLLTIPLINHTDTFAVYPLAKLEPVSAMPANVTFHNNGSVWQCFASAWLPHDTMPCPFYFDVTGPVPPNAPVTFQIWLTNLKPIQIDTCKFDMTFTVDFNSGRITGIERSDAGKNFKLINYAADRRVELISQVWNMQGTINLADISGRLLKQQPLQMGTQWVELNTFNAGIYLVYITGPEGVVFVQKIWLP